MPSAAHTNDETLLVIHSPKLAAHFTREIDRLWDTAELGITPNIQRKLDRQGSAAVMGWRGAERRGEWLERWLKICKYSRRKMAGFGEQKVRKKKRPQQKTEGSGESLLKNALQHHMQGDLVSAESGYRKAIQVGYYNHAIFINLGVICKNSGRPEEAILLYKKAIEINPNDPDAYGNLGNLYHSLGNFESAAAFSSKSIEFKPNNPEAL